MNLPGWLQKTPKSAFWKCDATWTPETWKIKANEESQKIDEMSRVALIEYIKDFTGTPVATVNLKKQLLEFVDKDFEDGRPAQVVFRETMKSIFDKLQTRLGEFDVHHIHETDDIRNVRKLMTGDISTSDYTVLYLVHRHMVKKAKQIETMKQKQENGKYSRILLGFIYRYKAYINLILH